MPPKPTKGKTPAAPTAEVSSVQSKSTNERSEPMNSSPASKNEPAPQNVQLIPVTFLEDTLVLVAHNAHPHVVMKPLVTAMGLDWRSQHVKIGEKFGSTMVEITTVAEDGKLRTMICLPLRKLPGWLYSLNPGKLNDALRPKVIRYQDECDEVLWKHWTGTYLPQHSVENIALSKLGLMFENAHTKICLELSKCTEVGIGRVLYDKYFRLSGQIGATIEPLETLAPGLRQKRIDGEGGAA